MANSSSAASRQARAILLGFIGLLLGLACVYIAYRAAQMGLMSVLASMLGIGAGGYLCAYSLMYATRGGKVISADSPSPSQAPKTDTTAEGALREKTP